MNVYIPSMHLGMEFLAHKICMHMLGFGRYCQIIFQNGCTNFYSWKRCLSALVDPQTYQHRHGHFLKICSHSLGCEVATHCGLTLTSLVTNNVKYPYICLFYFVRCLFESFCLSYCQGFYGFMAMSPFSDTIYELQGSSSVLWCGFSFLIVSFDNISS